MAMNLGLGLASSALSAFSSAASNKKAYKYQSRLQEQQAKLQYDYTRKLNQTAYQDTTQSMREAGINPMLAINNGINGLSSGSAGASFSGANPELESGINTALAYKQIKSQTKLNDSQEDVNKTQANLNVHSADAAHEQAAYIKEQNSQLQDYGPLKAQADINLVNANTAKALQDMQNSIDLTKSQIAVNSANAKYTSERSRGYTDSESYTYGGDTDSGGIGPFKVLKTDHGYSRSRSRTY